MAGFFEKISEGLSSTRDKFQEQVNLLLDNGPDLDDNFWDGLEEALISADIGAPATLEIVDNLKDEAKRKALPDANAVLELLSKRISEQFAKDKKGILSGDRAVLLFVGINGTGKTTTVGKIAKEATDMGLKVILGSADTFRAAAIEQLEVWAKRANVEIVTRERGSDPASVCYATIERAEELNSELVLIDTAGRLHTSKDLMAELEKVVNVTRKRSSLPVYVILVIDATTGQNGLIQAKEFNDFLNLDGLIVTKLDGTAKGGIALAISKELDLPILKIGVGEKIEDLRNFNANDFARAFIGETDNNDDTISEEENGIEEDKIQETQFVNDKENVNDELESEVEEQEDIISEVDNQESVDVDKEDKLDYNEEDRDYIINDEEQQEDKDITEKEPLEEEIDLKQKEDVVVDDKSENDQKNIKKGRFKSLFSKLFVD